MYSCRVFVNQSFDFFHSFHSVFNSVILRPNKNVFFFFSFFSFFNRSIVLFCTWIVSIRFDQCKIFVCTVDKWKRLISAGVKHFRTLQKCINGKFDNWNYTQILNETNERDTWLTKFYLFICVFVWFFNTKRSAN